jgi:3-hydroxybutyryl-CoA dehydratase
MGETFGSKTEKSKESPMIGKTYDQIRVGDSAEFSKTFSKADVYLYAGISGDFNPAHVNEAYARKTFFKTRIVHGMLSAGLISAVIGTQLPGPGSIYMRQTLSFLAPVHMGDTVTARVEVVEKLEKKKVRLKTTCKNQDAVIVLEGEALVSPPRR